MKALSVRQPWARLIVHGPKDIENRNWRYPPTFRGRFAVHAGRTFDRAGYEWVRDCFPDLSLPEPGDFERGGIVGMAELVDVVTDSDSDWFEGPLGLVLAHRRPTKFIACPGQLGFFELPAGISARLSRCRDGQGEEWKGGQGGIYA